MLVLSTQTLAMRKLISSVVLILQLLFIGVANAAFVSGHSEGVFVGNNITEGNAEEELALLLEIDSSLVTFLGKIDLPSNVVEGQVLNDGDFEIEISTLKESFDAVAGQWTCNNCIATANFISIKTGNALEILSFDALNMGLWDTSINLDNKGLSNIAAFHVVPIPATVWLLGSAMIGLIRAFRK
ncbi:MAG: putative membrane protein YiaA [Enterobacterales bacterium]